VITNNKTGLKYIGYTKHTPERRLSQHKYDARHPERKSASRLCEAIRQYGEENFSAAWLCEGDRAVEKHMIELLEPKYNVNT
jgi:predicted GIY-YIG superfamily endonuclease